MEDMDMHLEIITKKPASVTHPTPVLFVHGMWHAAWCWAEYFLPYFSQQGYVAHALSLRGHGDSEGRERLRWTSINDYVSDVAQVVGQLQSPPVLVGHSMGGMIVQKYLESHKAPAAVLLASAPPKGVIPATVRVFLRHPFTVLKVNLTMSMFPVVGTPRMAREGLFSTDMPEDKVTAYFAKLQDESYRAYLDMLGLNLPRPRQTETPMLVLGAANDTIISPKEVEATARAYGVEAEFFPGMAHDMMLEAGWQEVADRILVWLDTQGL
jgi:alpha-beta hydrolase superfamily lysophospholipase